MTVDFVIQGPYHPHTLEAIEKYSSLGGVILSCYNTDILPKLPSRVKVVQSPLPNTYTWYNRCNVLYQCSSTLRGIAASEADYIIKCRTEEIYGNIYPFVNKVINSNKLITGNVAFPRTSVQPFHPSDHLMGGNRTLMRNIFETCLRICLDQHEMKPFTWQDCLDFIGPPLAEQLLCLSYFQCLGVDVPKKPTLEQQRELMIKYLDVVPVEDMADVIHTINVSGDRRFRKNGEGLYGYPHESIKNINEI